MEPYAHVIIDLEKDLTKITASSGHILDNIKQSMKRCQLALTKLRELVIRHDFPDVQSEIRLFKEIKPVACSRLLFYQALFELESLRPGYDPARMKLAVQSRIGKIQRYMQEHAGYVQYYNCRFTYLDRLYFVRGNDEIPIELRSGLDLTDGQFNTWKDHTFSVIRANKLLLEHLSREISQRENPEQTDYLEELSPPAWTARNIDLVELIYALHYSRVINNGRISIKKLAKLFGTIFKVEIEKDVYRYFTEIQQRKIEQAKFIEHLKSALLQQIDQNLSA